MFRFVSWLIVLVLLSNPAFGEALQIIPARDVGLNQQRFALVIGNADYENVPKLQNTVNDAHAMAAAMSNVGFEVFQALNVNRRDMLDAVQAFYNAVTPGSEALIYYSGHGVEIEGQNFLLPVDIRDLGPAQQLSLEDDSLSLSRLLLHLEERRARVNIVLLDACRNNPFTARGLKALGAEAGLSAVEPPQGTLVIYSAAAGETALDRLGSSDADPNGLFTRNLLDLVQKPGLEIRSLAQQLKERVYETALTGASHVQRPSYYDGLIGQFYFMPPTLEPAPRLTACEQLLNPKASIDEVLLADTSSTVSACQQALGAAPGDPKFTDFLAISIEQRDAQKAIVAGQSVYAKAYLRLYPQGRYAEPVRLHLADLEVLPTPTPTPTPIVPDLPVDPTPTPLPAPTPALSGPQLAMAVQQALTRVGCSASAADGVWGPASRRALGAFANAANVQLASTDPSNELLATLGGYSSRVCAISCPVTQVAQGDQCVAKLCPAGQKLSSAGNCYIPKKTAVNVTPKKPSGGGGSAKCFTFNNESFCE